MQSNYTFCHPFMTEFRLYVILVANWGTRGMENTLIHFFEISRLMLSAMGLLLDERIKAAATK